jgi:hypothetical protein
MPRMKICSIERDLVGKLTLLSDRLNTLNPAWEHDPNQRDEIQQRRQELQIEIKQHRAKGHEGKPCPSFAFRRNTFNRG